MIMLRHVPSRRLAVFAATVLATSSTFAAGLYEDGAGARAKAMGGSGAAVADDPLSALFDNPAALGEIDRPAIQLGGDAAFAHGSFHNSANGHATMETAGVIGEFAAAVPIGPVRVALGFNPDIALRDRWHYRDALGGADGGTSYGYQLDSSEILLLRSALGASWQVLPTLSVGADVGLLYNENRLQTPYVFQTQPTLRRAKTLLDLQTDGLGWNAQGGIRWQAVPVLAFSVVYTSEARVDSHGRATGNAGVQLARLGLGAARPDFAYDADVENVFPQQVSAGVAWKVTGRLTLSGQFDYLDWSDAFDRLPVRLSKGNNADLNGLVGSHRLNDNVPLDWRDQYVGRLGVEQRLGDHWTLRAGYAYGNNPVPAGTLTPLNAAITEHLLTAGVGYRVGRVQVDAAYQWLVPATARVGRSGLAAGEYSDSVTEIDVQWIGVTTRIDF